MSSPSFLNLIDQRIFFCLFRATPTAYGSSQARGQIGPVAAGLPHSHSNVRSKRHLPPTPQLTATLILNPLSKARDRTRILMDISQLCFCWATTGTLISQGSWDKRFWQHSFQGPVLLFAVGNTSPAPLGSCTGTGKGEKQSKSEDCGQKAFGARTP